MTTNLFVIANIKQLRTGGSFRILLPFFLTSWSVGVLNSAIFNSFHNRVEFGTILEGLRNFSGGGVFEHPPSPPPGTPLLPFVAVKQYQDIPPSGRSDLHFPRKLTTGYSISFNLQGWLCFIA